MTIMTKEVFFADSLASGMSFKEVEQAWRESGFAIKRGRSAKENIRAAWLAGEVSLENLEEWLAENGTPNDIKQKSYYANRIEDFEEVARAYGGKRKTA